MNVLNYGSLNIDYVYRVPHISKPGETLSSASLQIFSGGKGSNQSLALAEAGVRVAHAGKVGEDGKWLIEKLSKLGVDTKWIRIGEGSGGHAIIQVDDAGENSIVLFAGCNRQHTHAEIDEVMAQFATGDILLLQNEVNNISYLIQKGHDAGLKVCLNPAPFGSEVPEYPLHLVDILVANETEAKGLVGEGLDVDIMERLGTKWPQAEIVLTLGEKGAMFHSNTEDLQVSAQKVNVVDTTAAGDTFIGYYIACLVKGMPVQERLQIACKASAVCVSKLGAADSIPSWDEVMK